jgi:hypothetical protein
MANGYGRCFVTISMAGDDVDGWWRCRWLVAMVRPSSIAISHQPSAMTGVQ